MPSGRAFGVLAKRLPGQYARPGLAPSGLTSDRATPRKRSGCAGPEPGGRSAGSEQAEPLGQGSLGGGLRQRRVTGALASATQALDLQRDRDSQQGVQPIWLDGGDLTDAAQPVPDGVLMY